LEIGRQKKKAVMNRNLNISLAVSFLIHIVAIALSTVMARPVSSPTYGAVVVNLIDLPPVVEKMEELSVRPKTKTVTPPKLVHRPDFVEPERLKSIAHRVESNEQKPADKPQVSAFSLPASGPEKGAGSNGKPPGEAEGGEAGAGDLFTGGDIAMIPGSGIIGGGGGQGAAGLGRGKKGDGSGGGGIGERPGQALVSARPLGGYQVKPRYPNSAREERAQGLTLLKVRVLENGRVGQILVEQSAGHPDLDASATEAVKKWRFEPARRGSEPVAVWVLLPVKFELR
jgi:TonB family protein